MSRRCFSSRSYSGRGNFSCESALTRGYRGANNLSTICYTGAGRCGGYSNISHYNIGRSRRFSGGSLGGYGGSSGGYIAGFRDYSILGYGSGIGPVGYAPGVGRPGGFSSHSAGTYSHAERSSSHSPETHSPGYSGGYRFSSFSSRSLGGGNRANRATGFGTRSVGGGFGYEPLGRVGEGRGIHRVTVNANLLRPLCISVDPEISRVKEEEREQMKTLNDQFAGFIDKVRHLEQKNKLLETKWGCLQQQGPVEKKSIDHLFENYIATLRRQLDLLLNEGEQLQQEQAKFHDVVEEYKCRYEGEINRRVAAENEFVVLKKDVDCAYTSKVELEVKVEALRQELEFLRCVHEAELESLQTTTADTNVVVSMDNSRELDMEGIIHSVRCQYEEIAQRSKEEVNTLYESKYKELKSTWGSHCNNINSSRREIQELTRLIQRLKSEMEDAKKQTELLQTAIAEHEEHGECALKDAKAKLAEVENALQSTKDELARLLRDYQELLNVKIALDIEIAMYKSLLEGEENRICKATPINISVTGSPNISIPGGHLHGGVGFGRRHTYNPGAGGPGYRRRHTSCTGGFSHRSGELSYKTGYSSRSGGNLTKYTVNSGFGNSTVDPCRTKECVLVDVGSIGGGGCSSSNNRSGSCNLSKARVASTVSSVGSSFNSHGTRGATNEAYVSGRTGIY